MQVPTSCLLIHGEGPPPPPAQSGGEDWPLETAAGPELSGRSAIQKQCFRFALVRNLKKLDSPLLLVRYSATAIFSIVCCHQSAILLFHYLFFTVVHYMPQFATQQFAIPQYAIPQYQCISVSISINPHYLIISSLLNIFKHWPKMQNSRIAKVPFQQSASAGPLFLPVRWSAIISLVCWAADSGPSDQNSSLLTSERLTENIPKWTIKFFFKP